MKLSDFLGTDPWRKNQQYSFQYYILVILFCTGFFISQHHEMNSLSKHEIEIQLEKQKFLTYILTGLSLIPYEIIDRHKNPINNR